jgi:Type II secretion system (T2SS), protein M subtype b
MKDQLLRLKADLGRSGLLAVLLLALALSFHTLVVQPLRAKNAGLEASISRQAPGPVARTGQKLEKLYDTLGREETATDWLAKLYAISKATGVEMQSANYKTDAAEKGSRIERYEITLPVSGTYAQLRDFLGRALAEIPVLSLDQINLRREHRREAEIQAELRLTLHLVKP